MWQKLQSGGTHMCIAGVLTSVRRSYIDFRRRGRLVPAQFNEHALHWRTSAETQ